ncbi:MULTISPECIES: bifunctional 4-hydroxy-2-oxoglutarate aldolase/2-dehydro-3-deoxy-phosphogluconate aldolase [Aphanothece]|uniref:bifunctional 4-hydroxy-2-oxoglutarate aldolase/2-dehydro-3-deoxy-phosphogluconate aldolase n=1 Tax=Aphanothece TaxID=1121 RepID=UPI003984929C
MPSTSEPSRPIDAYGPLIQSLHHQPLLVVLRAERPLDLRERLARLEGLGVRQVEIAWSGHPQWSAQCAWLRMAFPRLNLGAASVVGRDALEAAAAAGLAYAVSPVLDEDLLSQARQCGLALVPGVMSPSDVHRARQLGCPVVKLFPAITVGSGYWRRLRDPLGPLPVCVAAGGLAVPDVMPWLEAGVDAVALGGRLDAPDAWSALGDLIGRLADLPRRC